MDDEVFERGKVADDFSGMVGADLLDDELLVRGEVFQPDVLDDAVRVDRFFPFV